jgi:hypothetical protein
MIKHGKTRRGPGWPTPETLRLSFTTYTALSCMEVGGWMRRWMRCVYSTPSRSRWPGNWGRTSLFTWILLFFSLFFYYYYLFPFSSLWLNWRCVCVCVSAGAHIQHRLNTSGVGGGERGTSTSWRRVPLVDVPRSILAKESQAEFFCISL